MENTAYLLNPQLSTLAVEGYKGVPLDAEQRFQNLEFPYYPSLQAVWKWKTGKPTLALQNKKKDTWRMPVIESNAGFIGSKAEGIMWLGHASYFIRIGGKQLLIDPVFGKLSFVMPRYTALPVNPNAFKNIDFVLVSHDHRDHCDSSSLKQVARQNPQAHFLTGLRMDSLLRTWTGSDKVQAAGWYQTYHLPDSEIAIHYLPSRHWCRRYLTDTNYHLWGAFVIQAAGKTLYFGGDSGYGSHFETVKMLFGAPDVYFAGVGAYEPEWFMGPMHMSPKSAVEAAKVLDAQVVVPMHYGTFDLSDESLGNPYHALQSLQSQDSFLQSRLQMLLVGEVMEL